MFRNSASLPYLKSSNTSSLKPGRMLLVAAIFHLSLTLTIYALGRAALLPGMFDSNGLAISLATDSISHRSDAALLSEDLKQGKLSNWLAGPFPFHVKLYSVFFLIFGPLLGYNIIGVEPLNLLLYLGILVLVFHLAGEAFDERTALLAAATVALWPSFLLHTTQFLKDPLFMAAMLAFVLINLRWLTRNHSWPEALVTGAAGGLIAALLWLARDNTGGLVLATALIGAGILIIRQFRQKPIQTPNLVGLALLIVMTIGFQMTIPKFRNLRPAPFSPGPAVKVETYTSLGTGAWAAANYIETPPKYPWSRLGTRVMAVRHRFLLQYSKSGSNIDSDVQLNNTTDLLRYLPRAAAIGFFAPFPDMWLASGKQVGTTGRVLAGFECLAMYAIEALALFALCRERRLWAAWLLALVTTLGVITLGFVVVNAGALFRLRYVFLVLVIILGARGAVHLLGRPEKAQGEANAPCQAS